MDEDDIEKMEEEMKLYQKVRKIGRVGKWKVIRIIEIIVGIVYIYEKIMKMWGWFNRQKNNGRC